MYSRNTDLILQLYTKISSAPSFFKKGKWASAQQALSELIREINFKKCAA